MMTSTRKECVVVAVDGDKDNVGDARGGERARYDAAGGVCLAGRYVCRLRVPS